MDREYGSQSMVTRLRKVLVKRPDEGFAVEDYVKWHYTDRPDLLEAQREHDAFTEILRKDGIEVFYHDEPQPSRADSIFTYDPAIVTDQGAIILNMGKPLRRGEEPPMRRRLQELGIPILYTIKEDARVEGGDLLWIDHDTLAVGQGFRTNRQGLLQIREAVEPLDVEVLPVELPYFLGPEACLHLMSLISLVDHDLAVCYPLLMPVPFWKCLKERGFDLIEVSEEEFNAMGINVLALSPKRCLMLDTAPITKQMLEEAGCQVLIYNGVEISLKTEGGPTCLTRPILRDI